MTNHTRDSNGPIFCLGTAFISPGAEAAMEQYGVGPSSPLNRHQRGNWGQLPPADARTNARSLENGLSILSSYQIGQGARNWIITNAQRTATTMLLPNEY